MLVPEYQKRFDRHFNAVAPSWMVNWLSSDDEQKRKMAHTYKYIMEKLYACGIQDATLGVT